MTMIETPNTIQYSTDPPTTAQMSAAAVLETRYTVSQP